MTDKAVLTQGQARLLAIVGNDANLANSTIAQYTKALVNFWGTGAEITDAAALARHAQTVSKSGRSFLKAAIRKVTQGEAHKIRANVTPETVGAAQAALMRIEALQETIQVTASKGTKSHTWLSQSEVKRLLAACGDDLVGERDRVVIGLQVAAGLRRAEAAALRFDQIKLQPVGDRFRTVLDITGKGAKARTVPISDRLADALDKWRAVAGDGFVCRSLGMAQEIGDSLSAVAIFNLVRRRGRLIGFDGDKRPELASHDLRRTYAQLGHEAGVPITQISILLGHANVATTQRYLNLELDLETTVSDFVPF